MDRRQEIMQAAAKSFSLFGYKATTMDHVARIANVGKGTIYTFFENKEELFQAIVLQMIDMMKSEADKAGKAVAGRPFKVKVHEYLMCVLRFRKTHELYAKLIDEERELRTPAVTAMLEEIEVAIVSYIEEKMKQAIALWEIKDCDTELVAYLLFKSYVAFIVDWQKTHDTTLDEKRIISLLQGTILSSLTV